MGSGLRKPVLLAIDAVLIGLSLYAAMLTRFDGRIPAVYLGRYYQLFLFYILITIVCFYFFGLYRRLWDYASINELFVIFRAVTTSVLMNMLAIYLLYHGESFPIPRSVIMISWLYLFFFIGFSRLVWRLIRDNYLKKHTRDATRVLIVGAGDAGVMVMNELKRHYNNKVRIIGFIDDDEHKSKSILLGVPIFGGREIIPEIVAEHEVEEIILAMPSVAGMVINEIVKICQKTKVKVKTLPGVYELIEGKVTINQIKEVEVEDLLGRKQVKVDLDHISQYLAGKVILVTGAGGSIGSELCRQIVKFNPKELLLLDICENNVYDIEMELRNQKQSTLIYPLVKDVRDRTAIKLVFQKYAPDVIFHAAAHKHVPLMEANPEEAIKNNVLGTYNVAWAADKYGSGKFVLISTDKAVRSTSIMGASKRVAEMIIQYLDTTSKTEYAAVRFGNVLGSRGSVVPLFKKQIAKGGPVTVTDPEMVRYFMTIPEAVQLVIQAGAMAQGGEIFVLDMGDPVKIIDLAETIIKLSGFEPYQDIDIVFTGIRPGEKLYEELLIACDQCDSTGHQRIFVEKPNGLDIVLIEETISKLLLHKLPLDEKTTIQFLQVLLPAFRAGALEKVEPRPLKLVHNKQRENVVQLTPAKVSEST